MDVGQPEATPLVFVRQSLVIDSHQVQNRGIEVVDVDAIFDHIVAEFVGRSVADAWLDTTAGHPGGETSRMVVATVVIVG